MHDEKVGFAVRVRDYPNMLECKDASINIQKCSTCEAHGSSVLLVRSVDIDNFEESILMTRRPVLLPEFEISQMYWSAWMRQ